MAPALSKSGPARFRKGQAIVMVTLSLTFLFAVMGLAIDLGYAHYLKLRVQTVADAAATAAAVYAKNNSETCGAGCGAEYTCAGTTPPTTSLQAGCLYATQDSNPPMTAKIIENNTTPPGTTGVYPTLWFKATVSTANPNLFLFASGYQTASISGQAIAGVTVFPPPYCIYVLNSNAQKALSVSGSASLTVSGGCSIYVNSSHPTDALDIQGNASLRAGTGTIKVVGGASYPSGSITPTPTRVASPIADPLASLAAPTVGSCSFGTATTPVVVSTTVNLSPGVYCGGITVQSGGHATLSEGVYILNGNGLSVGSNGSLTASHVMFYNTANSGRTAKPIAISGGGAITVTAPISGTYKGVSFFQDRSVSYSTDNTFAGGSAGTISGTMYFKTTGITVSGSATAADTYATLICDTLTLASGASLLTDTTGTHTAGVSTLSTLIQ